jgi:hypothetical protein
VKTWTFFFCTFLFLTFAQAQGLSTSDGMRSWRRGTAIVLFSGVGGGVLGLSTLSFYGEPQKHTSNVTTGALIGMAAGLGYVIWESAQKSTAPTQTWTLTTQKGEPALAFLMNF